MTLQNLREYSNSIYETWTMKNKKDSVAMQNGAKKLILYEPARVASLKF